MSTPFVVSRMLACLFALEYSLGVFAGWSGRLIEDEEPFFFLLVNPPWRLRLEPSLRVNPRLDLWPGWGWTSTRTSTSSCTP